MEEAEIPTGRTLKAAHRADREGRRVVIKPGELIEAKFARGASPSLSARKVLALLIAKAGGDAWRSGSHTITKKELRGSHESNDRINNILDELMDVKFKMPTLSTRGRDAVLTAALIAWNIEETADDGMSIIEWEFSKPARQMLQGSDYYARINRAALLAFQSKYALGVYEIGCLLIGRRDKSWHGSVEEAREKLGVPAGSLVNFAEFRRSVLMRAKQEVDQIAHFTFEWTEVRSTSRGRRIEALDFRFALKTGAGSAEGVRHSKPSDAAMSPTRKEAAIEKAAGDRGDNVVTLPALLVFPLSGPIDYAAQPIVRIAREHGGGWDKNLIAQAYREQMGGRLQGLSGARLLSSWEGFCKSWTRQRGST
ncbi:replication initiation protein [Croceicoccus sp. F390]|uniref:Replication initiation protein n=1 Tax=Croceicoccus esteveae TaxID=3075597 RepID=A0ABU2ZLC8_9SPHN|nr:replication initiation protein [Croceicoccus sp. F390]MDT0577170.1 replication initiation protein [Croceicoccus sp. F390]